VPSADKASVQRSYAEKFAPTKGRSVWLGDGYAMRFSEAKSGSFSNTVLSLSALWALDARPFVVVVVRARAVDFLLANSTFLKKISHSSRDLRSNNIKGSFNGSDIITSYEGVLNAPENFEQLFARHAALAWEENVERLVEATNAIVGRDNRFQPSEAQKEVLLAAPERAVAAMIDPSYSAIEIDLKQLLVRHQAKVLEAARVDNVNLRGNAIEQLLTGASNAHELGDIQKDLDSGRHLVIDIKTKLLDRMSAPKAYNVDKMLSFLAKPGSVLAFFMIGLDIHAGTVSGRLFPVLENSLLDATAVQHHWAGRTSRGVTQLSGRFHSASDPTYNPTVNLVRARAFIQMLLAL
jgi:hypothetical protein